MRPKPEAILGSASHALASAVASGELDDVPEAESEQVIANRWDGFVAKERSRLAATGLLGSVPAAHRWPFYEVKRAGALVFAADLLARRRARWAAPRLDAWIETEVELVSEEPPLVGRIDRVEHTQGGVRIVDLKTSSAPRTEPEPAHVVQLLLYAALYRGATGESPYEVGIQYLDGKRVTRPVDWGEVDKLVKRVLDARAQVNQLAQRDPALAWTSLARPSLDACLFCDYQPVCAPFLENVASLLPSYASCVVGKVIDCVNSGETVRLGISSGAHQEPESDVVVTVLGIPASIAPKRGNRVSVCWAARRALGTDLLANWLSVLYIWE